MAKVHCCRILIFTKWCWPQLFRGMMSSVALSVFITLNFTHTHTQPFYGPFSGTTQVSRCQKRNFCILWCKGRFTVADTPAIRLGATPSGLTSASLHHPPHILYRPHALPATQLIASKHWRQHSELNLSLISNLYLVLTSVLNPVLGCKADNNL